MKKESFLKRNYSASWKFLKESSNYIIFALFIFVLFFIIGFIFPIFFTTQIELLLEKLSQSIEGLGLLETISFIFFNNLRSSAVAMIFGIGLGIFPLLTGAINGYLLGYVANVATASKGILILWRILPHGIFEIPAIIFSIGLGIKLGFDLFKKDKMSRLKRNIEEGIRAFIFIVIPLLILSAVIEGILIIASLPK